MSGYYRRKANTIIKFALLVAIEDIMKRNAVASFTWLPEGFDKDNQPVRFKFGGSQCTLDGVGCPNLEHGILPLKFTSKSSGKTYDCNLKASSIHINTLEKIAKEVYDTLCDPDVDEEWEVYRKQLVSDYLDTHIEP